MPQLTLRFLGPPEIIVDGTPVHLPRQRSLALLAYLVLSGRPHPREELAALLCSETVGSQERKLLRNALTTLGEHLGDYLLTDRQTIAFNAALPHELDLATLAALLDDTTPPDPAALEWALAQYDADVLAGLSLRDAPLFEAWLERTREHVRQQLAQVAQRLLEYYLRHGDIEQGIALARRLLTIEPWQEATHRLLMRLLARNGQRVEALAQYALCRKALAAEFGVEPQPETTALHERLRGAPFAPRHNLPVPKGPVIGRDAEVAEIVRLLGTPGRRLVTITGLGGSGKSRIALAAAAQLLAPAPLAEDHPFPDGGFLVDLSGIVGPGSGKDAADKARRHLALAIGLALGLVFYGQVDRVEQLVAYLRSKRLLLILDGLERLTAGAAALQEILKEAPGVSLLATTRTRLGLPEEYVRHLGRLALPHGPDTLEQAPASQLFLSEVERLHGHLAPEDRGHVVTICRLVNGLPLALILAASWSRVLSCAQIARDLASGGALLKAPECRQPDRGEGLDAIIAFAWRSLPARGRRALRDLAVFGGHFDRPAAEALGIGLSSVLLLCEHALVERDEYGGYLLHPLVRQYAADQLARRPEEEARLRAGHAAYYAATFARQARELGAAPEAHERVVADQANLVLAWEWAAAHLDLGMLARLRDGLATWFRIVGMHHEWAEALETAIGPHRAALADRDDPAVRVSLGWLLAAEANAWMWQGNLDRAYPLLAEARQCARSVGMIPLEVQVDLYEGRLMHYQGEDRAATDLLTQALTLARAIQERRFEAESLLSLGLASADVGRLVEAEAQLLQAEQLYRTLGDRLALGRLAVHRSRLYLNRGEYIQAEVALKQGLQSVQSLGNRREEGWAHAYLAFTHDLGFGRHRQADGHYDEAHAVARESGDLRFWTFVWWGQGLNALHIGDFARADRCFGESLDQGRATESPVAIARALYGQGLLAHARGDAAAVENLVRQAIRIAESASRRPDLALDLLLLGQLQADRGLTTAAAETYTAALAIARELSLRAVYYDALAGLASVALVEGQLGRAAEHASAIVPYLQEHGLAGCGEPGWVALTCYRALHAVRDPHAEEALRLGAALLEWRIAALPEASRPRYRAAFPARGELLQLWREQQAGALVAPLAAPIPLFAAGVPAAKGAERA